MISTYLDFHCNLLIRVGRTPAVVLLGCFNAVAQQCDYPPLTYRAVKGEGLMLACIYVNDHIFLNLYLVK